MRFFFILLWIFIAVNYTISIAQTSTCDFDIEELEFEWFDKSQKIWMYINCYEMSSDSCQVWTAAFDSALDSMKNLGGTGIEYFNGGSTEDGWDETDGTNAFIPADLGDETVAGWYGKSQTGIYLDEFDIAVNATNLKYEWGNEESGKVDRATTILCCPGN